MGTVLVYDQGKRILQDVHILGKMIQKTSVTVAGILLARGLERVANQLISEAATDNEKQHKIIIYTDYEPLHNPHQRQRWETYGAPDTPSPEANRLNKALEKWTRWAGATGIWTAKANAGKLNLTVARKQRQQELHRKSTQDIIGNVNLLVIPMTQEEIKQLLKDYQNKDEERVIRHLAYGMEDASVASKIYKQWGLNRQIIKECHIAMSRDRILQTTFNNLISATRFKTVEGGKLMPVSCPRKECRAKDSWEHFQECYNVPDIGNLEGKQKIEAIVYLRKQIQTSNPIRPTPHSVTPSIS